MLLATTIAPPSRVAPLLCPPSPPSRRPPHPPQLQMGLYAYNYAQDGKGPGPEILMNGVDYKGKCSPNSTPAGVLNPSHPVDHGLDPVRLNDHGRIRPQERRPSAIVCTARTNSHAFHTRLR